MLIKLFFGLSFMAFALFSGAQDMKEDFKLIQNLWGKEKKAITSEALKLTGEEANKFWPLYEAYQVERQKIGQSNLDAVKNYADNFESMTDARAGEIAASFLSNSKELNNLQRSYLKKISKAVSPIKAVQFLQLEAYIDSHIKAALYDELPFLPHPKN